MSKEESNLSSSTATNNQEAVETDVIIILSNN